MENKLFYDNESLDVQYAALSDRFLAASNQMQNIVNMDIAGTLAFFAVAVTLLYDFGQSGEKPEVAYLLFVALMLCCVFGNIISLKSIDSCQKERDALVPYLLTFEKNRKVFTTYGILFRRAQTKAVTYSVQLFWFFYWISCLALNTGLLRLSFELCKLEEVEFEPTNSVFITLICSITFFEGFVAQIGQTSWINSFQKLHDIEKKTSDINYNIIRKTYLLVSLKSFLINTIFAIVLSGVLQCICAFMTGNASGFFNLILPALILAGFVLLCGACSRLILIPKHEIRSQKDSTASGESFVLETVDKMIESRKYTKRLLNLLFYLLCIIFIALFRVSM